MNKKKHKPGGSSFLASLRRFLSADFFSRIMETNLPAANVRENGLGFKLEILVPGFEREDLRIHIDRDILTVSTRTGSTGEETNRGEKILRREFSSSHFSRKFALPKDLDTDKIESATKNGVLTIKLPKLKDARREGAKKERSKKDRAVCA